LNYNKKETALMMKQSK